MATIFDTNPDWEKDEDGTWHCKKVKVRSLVKEPKQESLSTAGYKGWDNGGYGHGGYGGTTSTGKWACNHKPKEVKVGSFSVWPTKEAEVDAAFLSTLDVACPLTDYGSAKDAYNDFCGLLMWIPIKDYNVPSQGRLITNARRIVQFAQAGARVGFWCVGSHGRTGLVLATVIGLVEPEVDPIDATRERHCKHCVETQSQIEMVFKALGRDLPEKWKPKAETKISPSWVQEGNAWSSVAQGPSEEILSAGITTCDLCTEGPDLTAGKGILHWYGELLVHDSCFKEASDKAAEKKLAEEITKVEATVVESAVATNIEQTVPTNDTKALTTSTNATNTVVDTEHFKLAVAATRPFKKHWAAKMQKKFSGLLNKLDHFGDVICPQCKLLILYPLKVNIISATKDQSRRWAQHIDCAAADVDPDCHPLCVVCYDGPADVDGFCSEECSLIDMNDKYNKV